MNEKLGESKNIFYFSTCGAVNTEKTLELAIQRAKELKINKLVIASETGLSALKAVNLLKGSEINLIVITSAAGTQIEKTAIGDLKIGISDEETWHQLKRSGAQIIRATDPLYNIGAAIEHKDVPTLATIIRRSLGLVSSGTSVCVGVTLMATDNGILTEGEEVVAVAGSWVGLDTAVVIKAANSVNLLKPKAVRLLEIICKPLDPFYTWPINQKDWVGDLEPYRKYV
ncbi:MAG: hypothetical protein ACFFDT_15545 [Candidatus Hodarchaeota archaeon]